MSFKPAQTESSGSEGGYEKIDYNALNMQVKGGNRPARIGLIVDLGVQNREDLEMEYKPDEHKDLTPFERDGKQYVTIPRKPAQEIAMFADLTSDVVDYGDIGKQSYRLLMNKSYMGNIQGISFSGCYSFDKQGQILKDKGFTFHSNSIITKTAKATCQEQIISGSGDDNMDVAQLLGKPLMVQVDKTEKDGGKCYINFKGVAQVPMIPSDPSDPDSEEVMMTIKEATQPAMLITFDTINEENKKYLNGMVVNKIKQATNYVGSKMQEVLEGSVTTAPPQQATSAPTTAKVANTPADAFDDFDEDIPF